MIGVILCVFALLPSLMRLTILVVDEGLGIPVWSPACQGLAYQLSFVGWLRLLTFSYYFDTSPFPQRCSDFIPEKSDTICQTPHHTVHTARTGRSSAVHRISNTRHWVFASAIDSSADTGIWSRGLTRRDAGMDIRETRSVDRLLPVDR